MEDQTEYDMEIEVVENGFLVTIMGTKHVCNNLDELDSLIDDKIESVEHAKELRKSKQSLGRLFRDIPSIPTNNYGWTTNGNGIATSTTTGIGDLGYTISCDMATEIQKGVDNIMMDSITQAIQAQKGRKLSGL